MVVDDLFSVVHAAVTDFYGVAVEDFSKFVAFRHPYVTDLVKPNLVGYFPQPGEILANLRPGQFRNNSDVCNRRFY